jgi:hypothetical protein
MDTAICLRCSKREGGSLARHSKARIAARCGFAVYRDAATDCERQRKREFSLLQKSDP